MTAYEKTYNKDNVIQKKGSNTLITDKIEGAENIDLEKFVPTLNLKGVNVVANSSYTSDSDEEYNCIYSSSYTDNITAKNGKYYVKIQGTGNKTVTTGEFNDKFYIASSATGKNTIKAGSKNDTYSIYGGVNKITDKGGDNKIQEIRTLSPSDTTIVTGAGKDIFDKILIYGGSKLNIKTAKGNDELHILVDDSSAFNINYLTADLGDDDDTVTIDFNGSKVNTLRTNIKTGKGKDKVTVSAGFNNVIDTGNDDDLVTIGGGYQNSFITGNGNDTIEVISNADKTETNSTIKSGAGDDIININGGDNVIYGDKGNDIITLKGDSKNIVFADGDTVNIEYGVNTINTKGAKNIITIADGANTINALSGKNAINVNGGEATTINLLKGNNTVNVNGDSSVSNLAIENGNNTINLKDTATATLAGTKGNTTVNIEGTSAIQGQLGSGKDIIKINSTHSTGVITNLGAGNDTVTVINATSKSFYGEKGNDIFTMTAGTTVLLDGGDGKDKFTISNCTSSRFNGGNDADTFIFEAGTGTNVYGGFGKDIFTINGGDGNIFFGEEDNDVFNVKAGTCGVSGGDGNDTFNIEGGTVEIAGREGNDIINIKGGSGHKINGESGDDTYNLFIGANSDITDSEGNNIYNIKNKYSGKATIYNSSNLSKVVLDKGYKLSSLKNVSDNNSVSTDGKTVSIWTNYILAINPETGKPYGMGNSKSVSLIFDIQDNIENNHNNRITVYNAEDMGTYTIGGKNYTLNLDKLQQDLTAWNTQYNSGGTYDSVNEVMEGTDAALKSSLVAIFTQDTADCFIKA